MTTLVSRLGTTVKAARPGALVTVATAPDIQDARDHRLQDWAGWLQAGLVDAVCPMAYSPEPAKFAEQIAAARDVKGGRAVWAGIGAYRLRPARDDREHRNCASPWDGRRRPLLLRQPDRPATVIARPYCGRRPIGIRQARSRVDRHSVTAATAHDADLARLHGHRRVSGRHHDLRFVVRPVSENHPELLSERPVRAVVGHLLHDRRDRNEHASVSSACPRRHLPAT